MSHDLLQQLRAYGDDFLAAQGEIRLEDVKSHPVRVVPPRRSPSRGWLVAAAAATIVAVVFGGFFLLFGPFGGEEAPVVTQPAVRPSVSPATSAAPLPVGSESTITGDGWTKQTIPGLVGTGEVRDLTRRGSVVVAVGTAQIPCVVDNANSTSTCRPTAWVSQDGGETWRALPIGEAGDDIWAVATTRSGFVAVGVNEIIGSVPQGIVWISPDGVTWDRRVDPELVGASLSGVVDGPAGLLASGFCSDTAGDCQVAAWMSADGIEWSKTHDFEVQTFYTVGVAGYDGGYAVAAVVATNPHRLQVWTSPDGQTWRGGTAESSTAGTGPAVAVSRSGIVSLSDSYGGSLAVQSTDGITWTQVTFEDPAACAQARFRDVDAGADGFVAVGRCGAAAGFWVSDTGATWQLLATDHEVFTGRPWRVYADEQGVIGVSSSSDFDVWVTTGIP